jgi:hypothetical protein
MNANLATRALHMSDDSGRSSGPKAPEGRARVATAHTKHGREMRAIRQERIKQRAYLTALEVLGRTIGLNSGPLYSYIQ